MKDEQFIERRIIKKEQHQRELNFEGEFDFSLSNAIKALIIEAATLHKNNRKRMARALGISISALYKKIKEHKLEGKV